jgi:hypothetical protein
MRTYRFKFVWLGTSEMWLSKIMYVYYRVLLLSLEILQDPDSQCSVWECPKFKAPTKLKCWFLIMYWPSGLHLSVVGKDLPNTACLRDGTIHCMAHHGNFKNLIACQPNSTLYTPHWTIYTPDSTLQHCNTTTLQRAKTPHLHSTFHTLHSTHSTLNTRHTPFSIILHTSPC